jgi:hypothetical protein
MNIIIENYYLSEPGNLDRLLETTDLAKDEVEELVGRFATHSQRSGKLRGEVIIFADNTKAIRHHFRKNIIWREE